MKVILATPIYPPEIGGPATYVKELSERLHTKHDLTVIAYTDIQVPFEGTKLIPISKRRPLPVRLVKFFLAVLKEAKNCDLIYVQNAMAAGLPVALVSMITKKPFVVKFVGDEAWERASQAHLTEKRLKEFYDQPEGNLKIKLMMAVQRFVLNKASLVTTPSAYLRDEVVRGYKLNPRKGVVNYNAAEDTVVSIPFEVKKKPHQIITTVRLVTWKGVDGIIRALSIVKKNFPDARLVVAGDGPETDNLKKLAEELDLKDSVNLLGKISRAETWKLRKESDVYVLNSTYEGLPHTVLTCFAAQIPTIATNIPGTNEAIYNEDTGLLVEVGDTAAIAKAIERVFNDQKLGERLVENGLKLLKDKFSWEAHLENLEGLFQSVVLKPRHK